MPDDSERPFWSVMIPTRDRPELLRRALLSVLSQDPGSAQMQIEVVDNSVHVDGAVKIVREVGGERVAYFRGPQPIGMAANWTRCVERARGRWVHILHDDDMVLDGFYARMLEFAGRHPQAVMVFCRAIAIDADDEWLQICRVPASFDGDRLLAGAGYELAQWNFIPAAGCVVARRAYEAVGGFAPEMAYTADWEMWARVMRHGPARYVHRPLALYRAHAGSDSEQWLRGGRAFAEMLATVDLLTAALPPAQRVAAHRHARVRYGAVAADHRARLHGSGHHREALRHAWWALRLVPSAGNAARVLKSAGVALLQRRDGSRG